MTKKSSTKPGKWIAVTSGEPGGVGPEIAVHLFKNFTPTRSTPVIVGSWTVLAPWLKRYRIRSTRIAPDAPALFSPATKPAGVYVLDTGCRSRFSVGKDSRGGGLHAGKALDLALNLAGAEGFRALVTAPISKKSLNLGGYRFPGHTEMLSRFFKAPDCQMMMVYRGLRVVPLTRHVPIKEVSRNITSDRILTALEVVNTVLKSRFGVEDPLIGVCGLNPHAGEGGLLGNEEVDIIVPALRKARRRGIRVAGPISADALFQKAQNGTFDAFVSMYHDQGLIPFKMLAKKRGINVTVGLPVVRTSVDHGVAYDIAGKGIASVDSMEQAYRLAERLIGK